MIEILLLLIAISIDSLVIGITYGMKKIHIPVSSIITINIICTVVLFISMLLGKLFKFILPNNISNLLSFFILLSLGVYYIIQGTTKNISNSERNLNKIIEIKISSIRIVVDIAVDCTKADLNKSGDLDILESIYLGIALSIDALGIGIGSAMSSNNIIMTTIYFFILNIIMLYTGLIFGKKVVTKSDIELSWLSGIILIVLAITKLF